MVTVDLVNPDVQPKETREQHEASLSREIDQFLEEARPAEAAEMSATRRWYYQIPCPGVRYYSF